MTPRHSAAAGPREGDPDPRYPRWMAFLRVADRVNLACAVAAFVVLGVAVWVRGSGWAFVALSCVGVLACCFLLLGECLLNRFRGFAGAEESLAALGGVKRVALKSDVAIVIAAAGFMLWLWKGIEG